MNPRTPLSAQQPQTVSLCVTAEAIRAYAELTDDFNPIHLDPEFAARTPMGQVIAHGTMSLCLIWQFVERNFGAAALDSLTLDVRFVKPVHVGDVITAGGQPKPDAHGVWSVWVRGADGVDRIVGDLTPAAAERGH